MMNVWHWLANILLAFLLTCCCCHGPVFFLPHASLSSSLRPVVSPSAPRLLVRSSSVPSVATLTMMVSTTMTSVTTRPSSIFVPGLLSGGSNSQSPSSGYSQLLLVNLVQELLHRGLAARAEGDESISVGSLLAGSVQDNSVLHLSVLGKIFKQVGVLHPSRNTSY